MTRIEKMLTNLKCNNCGHEFVASVPHEPVHGGKRGILRWARYSTEGAVCPECDSKWIGWGRQK